MEEKLHILDEEIHFFEQYREEMGRIVLRQRENNPIKTYECLENRPSLEFQIPVYRVLSPKMLRKYSVIVT